MVRRERGRNKSFARRNSIQTEGLPAAGRRTELRGEREAAWREDVGVFVWEKGKVAM